MKIKSLGFIGGGRVTGIILEGLERKDKFPEKVAVSETNPEVLARLKDRFPTIKGSAGEVKGPAGAALVFIALHPPAVTAALAGLKGHLKKDAVVVSLAPKISLNQLSAGLGGFDRIIRMIPNAPSVVNKGYNPVAFSPAFTGDEKKEIRKFFEVLGDCPEVAEEKLEAYAILTAMGPTYLWFQLEELKDLGMSFGLTARETEKALAKMVKGTVKTLYEAKRTPTEVMDLVPVKPLGEDEEAVRKIYRVKLKGLYAKLKG
ncbi:MAG TPA: NAD(P)-binding domain-containing protein [Syntrophales bacterium]|jgi:pyrroline-5-carboxylate reductase|nr:NAD(P)-binding domain-containing protein [Syntrophales bacterium]HQG35054.1 NAD(P)-binding domain-containing protein [Syntrophales bacterium]HQI36357.1 NAD(P)-binding domain-containing protein [Syntrophales bacterium]HRU89667.1 NAD(P)-binding domain-containing protein [Syntrophales bacterium]